MKYLFLTLGLLSALSAHAQQGEATDYIPIGKIWHCCQYMPEYRESDLTISGDTVVNGISCRKLVQEYGTPHEYQWAYLHQDGQKLYEMIRGDSLVLLYDFGLKAGDSIMDRTGNIAILKVDSVLSMGHRYQRQTLGFLDYSGYMQEEEWIEGIGAGHEPTVPYFFNVPGNYYWVLWVSVNGEKVYNSDSVSYIRGSSFLPMLEQGKIWNCAQVYSPAGMYEPFSYQLAGDTLIGDGLCWKMYQESQLLDCLSEDKRKVYSVGNGDGGTLYDFIMDVGDTLQTALGTVRATYADEVTIGDVSRERLGVTSDATDDTPLEYWVRGIGSSHGPVPVTSMGIIGPRCELVSCERNGKLLFTRDDFFKLSGLEKMWVTRICDRLDNEGGYVVDDNIAKYGLQEETYSDGGEHLHFVSISNNPVQGKFAMATLCDVRELDGKIYANKQQMEAALGATDGSLPYPDNGQGELTLFDYTANVGDAYLGNDSIRVTEIGDTTLLNGSRRRYVVLSTGHRLVEGAGCVNALGNPIAYLLHPVTEQTDHGLRFSYLSSFYEDDTRMLYTPREEGIKGFGITDGIGQAHGNMSGTTNHAYDIIGRRIGTPRPGQVYIKDGRKRMETR